MFTQKAGIGIQKYILLERLRIGAQMLCYTKKTISEIATYLCFPSQSYFGSAFKKQYNMTPAQYRATHRPVGSALEENDRLLQTLR